MTELEKQILQEYKSACGLCNGRSINQRIRQGESPREVEILDKLMEEGETPIILYRVLDDGFVDIKDGVIQDSAFLSTSSDAEYAMSSYMSAHTALYIIKDCDKLPSINVVKCLGDTNYESEFILPRNTKFKVLRREVYQSNHWAQLIEDFSLDNVNERSWVGVDSIVVYEISPIK